MEDFLDRLIIEEKFLDDKIQRLQDVVDNEFYPTHKTFMKIQLNGMKIYLIALRERIEIEKQINK